MFWVNVENKAKFKYVKIFNKLGPGSHIRVNTAAIRKGVASLKKVEVLVDGTRI